MDAEQKGTTVSPLTLVLSIWITVLGLSLYGAKHIQDEVAKSEMLSQETWLVDALTQVGVLSERLGLPAIEAKLGVLREAINEEYMVLVKEVVDEAPPTDVAPPVKQGDLVHRRAPAKKRVLVIGASSIQFAIGVELEKRLPTYKGVKVKRFGQLATGLSRPDFMDWPKKLESLATKFKPDLVITNFGGNDAQSIPTGKFDKVKFGTKAWDKKYAERVKEIIHIAKKHGAETVMMGMPIMRSPQFTKKIRRLNRVTEQAVREEGALFIPTFKMASMPDGSYRKSIKYGGKRGLMRTSDGVHYTRLGAKFVVEQVMQRIEREYVFEGPEADRGRAERHTFVSEKADRDVDYVAYRPKADGEYPGVLIFSGAAWAAWPDYPHRRLQSLAEKSGVLLVVPDLNPADGAIADEFLRDVTTQLPVSDKLAVLAVTETATAATRFIAAHRERINAAGFVARPKEAAIDTLDGVQIIDSTALELTDALESFVNAVHPPADAPPQP